MNPGTWEVPVTFATAAEPDFSATNWEPKLWIHKDVLLASHTVDNTDQWIVVNPDARSMSIKNLFIVSG